MIIVSKKKLSEMNNNSTEKNIIQEERKLNMLDDTRNKRTDEYDTEVLVSYSKYTDEGPSYPQDLRYMRSSDIGKFDNVVKCDRCGKYMTGGVSDNTGRYCNACERERTLRSIILDPQTDKALHKIVKGEGTIQEAEDEKTFEVEYTVTYKKNMKGTSVGDVQSKIKNDNMGNQVSIRYTREVAPMTEDFGDEHLGKEENTDDDFPIDLDETPDAPEGEDVGISNMLNDLVIDELDAVNGYNSAIATIKDLPDVDGADDAVNVLSDIANEENMHIGEIQQLLKMFSDQAVSIDDGKKEAQEIIDNTPKAVPQEAPKNKPMTLADYELEVSNDNFVVDDDISF